MSSQNSLYFVDIGNSLHHVPFSGRIINFNRNRVELERVHWPFFLPTSLKWHDRQYLDRVDCKSRMYLDFICRLESTWIMNFSQLLKSSHGGTLNQFVSCHCRHLVEVDPWPECSSLSLSCLSLPFSTFSSLRVSSIATVAIASWINYSRHCHHCRFIWTTPHGVTSLPGPTYLFYPLHCCTHSLIMTTWASFQQRYTQLTAELRNRRFDMSREPSRTIDGNSQQQPQSQQSQQPPLATGGTGGTGGGGGGGVGASNTNSNNNNNSSTSNSHSPSDIFNSIKNLSLNSTASSTSSSISAPSFNLTPSPVSPASSSKVPSLTPTSEKGGQQMTTTTTTTTTTTPKSENSSFARSFMTGRLSLGKGSLSTRLNQFFFSGSPESPSEKEASPSNGDHFLRATTATEIINNHCLSPRPRPRPLGLGPGSPRRPGPLGIEAMGRPFPTSDLSFVTGMPDALNTLCINGSVCFYKLH